jgi:uncharacterized membrane protein
MSIQDNIPYGQSSNPSTWNKRIFLLLLAIAGFLIALYLGLYQLHLFPNVWEPFFGNGTNAIVESSFSRSLPVPDGLLGAFGYLCDIIFVCIGDNVRWKTKPWIVILYSILIGMMGLVSLLLILLQAFVIHTWCTLCLCSAVLSLSMVIPVLQEFRAVLHYIKTEKRNGETFWEAVKAN